MSQTMCIFAITKYVFWTNLFIYCCEYGLCTHTQSHSIARSFIHPFIRSFIHGLTERSVAFRIIYLTFELQLNMYIQLYITRYTRRFANAHAKFILLDKIWCLPHVYIIYVCACMQRQTNTQRAKHAASKIHGMYNAVAHSRGYRVKRRNLMCIRMSALCIKKESKIKEMRQFPVMAQHVQKKLNQSTLNSWHIIFHPHAYLMEINRKILDFSIFLVYQKYLFLDDF